MAGLKGTGVNARQAGVGIRLLSHRQALRDWAMKNKSFHKLVLKMREEMKNLSTHQARLNFLIRWSNVVARKQATTLQARRAAFNRMPRPQAEAPCWCCARVAELVRHHVIQLQHGGGNWHLNIVPICNGCHAAVHPWLEALDHPLVIEAREMDVIP